MKQKVYFILFMFLAVTLVGCEFDLEKISTTATESITQADKTIEDWQVVSTGMQIKEVKILDDLGLNKDLVTILKIAPANFNFEVRQDGDNPKSVFSWQEELGAKIVVNAAYFDENYLPTGYLKDSQKNEFGNLYLRGSNNYTGAFLIDETGLPQIYYLPTANLSQENIDSSQAFFQTFPTLILPGGQKAEVSDSAKQANRTVLAQDKQGDFYIIISQQNSLTLFEMQDFLYNFEEDIDVAINLDGGTSSGLAIETEDVSYHLSSFYVSSVLAIYEK